MTPPLFVRSENAEIEDLHTGRVMAAPRGGTILTRLLWLEPGHGIYNTIFSAYARRPWKSLTTDSLSLWNTWLPTVVVSSP